VTDDLRTQQKKEWEALYPKIRFVLLQYAAEDEVLGQKKEFFLVDENLGYTHRIETDELELIRPAVVKALQELLVGYPNWEIMIALGDYGGLIIRDDEIIDDLQREGLPAEYQTIKYEGSRRQDWPFGFVFRPF
jgi:hypothetical protein